MRYIIVTWQAVIPPCFCAVALLIKYVTFTQTHPVRVFYLQQPFPLTDDFIRRGNHKCGIRQFKLCWASCMFYPCILHCKHPLGSLSTTPSWVLTVHA
jgi:hypothetical protein